MPKLRTRARVTEEERTLRRTAAYLARNARHRSKRKGLPCEITREWVYEKLRRGVCEATGVALRIGGDHQTPWSPSLDRMVPSRGYVKSNVRLTSMGLNALKATSPNDEDAMKYLKSVVSIYLSR